MSCEPDELGHFGLFGGRFVAETLMAPLLELEAAWNEAWVDPGFQEQFRATLEHYVGRPTPLYEARRLSALAGGARLILKREDLCHTGAHKINNTVGQVLLAVRMGKKRVIAETGAGQHGVATATMAAQAGLSCTVYMGARDMERQQPNVLRMRLLGAEVRPVHQGAATLKDAMNEAMRDWVTQVDETHYVIGTVAGPHPYPVMVRQLQAVIGCEAREQMVRAHGALPQHVVACIGGGSNAMGIFHAFRDDQGVALVGVEAAGCGIDTQFHAASLAKGRIGVLHGSRSYLLQDEEGQITESHSISAGLDYPGVGPEHAWLHHTGRASYVTVTDEQALEAFKQLAATEGILPALESSHALAHAMQLAARRPAHEAILVCLSGRGDKDLAVAAERLAP
jgi:tryptophan synthase beta chain